MTANGTLLLRSHRVSTAGASHQWCLDAPLMNSMRHHLPPAPLRAGRRWTLIMDIAEESWRRSASVMIYIGLHVVMSAVNRVFV